MDIDIDDYNVKEIEMIITNDDKHHHHIISKK